MSFLSYFAQLFIDFSINVAIFFRIFLALFFLEKHIQINLTVEKKCKLCEGFTENDAQTGVRAASLR